MFFWCLQPSVNCSIAYGGDKECGLRYAATNMEKITTSVKGPQGQNTCRQCFFVSYKLFHVWVCLEFLNISLDLPSTFCPAVYFHNRFRSQYHQVQNSVFWRGLTSSYSICSINVGVLIVRIIQHHKLLYRQLFIIFTTTYFGQKLCPSSVTDTIILKGRTEEGAVPQFLPFT